VEDQIVSLDELRAEIDQQDHILLEAVAKRFSLVRRIAQWKEKAGLPLHDPERERELIERRIASGRSHGLEEGFLVQMFDLLLGHSIRLQRSLVLDLASPRADGSLPRLGTLRLTDHRSEFALRNHFALGEKFTWYSAMRDLGQALQEGRIDYGVVPLLRADGLVLPEVCEELMASPLSIIGMENVIMSEVAGADRQVSSTRFLVISRDPSSVGPDQTCTTAVLFKALGGAEGMAQSIWGLKQHGVELLGFHQVPAPGRADPLFLLFLAGSETEPPLGQAIDDLRRKTELLKVLGSYPSSERGARSAGSPARATLAVVV
jgi:chorismate mutase/prephenate dehydratase